MFRTTMKIRIKETDYKIEKKNKENKNQTIQIATFSLSYTLIKMYLALLGHPSSYPNFLPEIPL